jgi:hypothetical protein
MMEVVKQRIDRLNASAIQYARSDRFDWKTHRDDKHTSIVTEHHGPWGVNRKAVAMELVSGELRSARVVKNGKGHALKIKADTPKSWEKLAGKSADSIVDAVGVAGFTLLLGGSAAVAAEPTTPFKD